MPVDSEKIEFLVGDKDVLLHAPNVGVLSVFSDLVIDFLSDLSKDILSDTSIREYKDVVGFGYWIRRASIKAYSINISRLSNRLGRGVCFHIAPANIPVQFAVSLVPAILAGNISIIRCSSKSFTQTRIICSKINKLLDNNYQRLKPYICILKYDHNDEITKWISSFSDVRVIWGGDETITHLKSLPSNPRTIDVAFSDRFSIAIINSDEVVNADADSLADSFWTDTYYVDQNACSSPRLVIWLGSYVEEARLRFWSSLGKKVKRQYKLEPIQASKKLTSFGRVSTRIDDIKLVSSDNFVIRVEVGGLDTDFIDYKESGGYFFEYIARDLNEVLPVIRKKACQTIGVFGFPLDVIKDLVFKSGCKGVDRIVKIGNTTAPGLDWDGYNLIETLSRYLEVN